MSSNKTTALRSTALRPTGVTTRRHFLERSTATVVGFGAAAFAMPRRARAVPASEKVVMAAIGIGGRCSSLIDGFLERGDVRFATLCDVNPKRDRLLAMRKRIEEAGGARPAYEKDYRKVLDDPSIDAVIVATPDHWHAPLTVFACQAGKDVYVEKPPSHNVWEGRMMANAARRHERVVQVGTQNRSAPYVMAALEAIRGGELGKIHLTKVYNLKSGGPFRRGPDGSPPEGMDYDTWLGPAPERPFNSTIYHGGWHQYWDFSGGDLADDGIHQLDIARWLTGTRLPRSVHSTGGRFAFPDDRETPDTQVVSFKYDDMVMTFELTQYAPYMRKTNGQIRRGKAFPYWPQNSTRIELYGSKNLMILGRHGGGWQIFTGDGKVVKESYGMFPDAPHKENFIRCIKSRERPSADAEEGHLSAALVHLANISYRLGGRRLTVDPDTETIIGDRRASRLLRRNYRGRFGVPESG